VVGLEEFLRGAGGPTERNLVGRGSADGLRGAKCEVPDPLLTAIADGWSCVKFMVVLQWRSEQ